MNSKKLIKDDDTFVITGKDMRWLIQLSGQLTATGQDVTNSLFDWPVIMRELIDNTQFSRAVTQQWVHGLTYMQQSTILTAIRGPDNSPKYAPPKMLLRWFRRCILVSALDGVVLSDPKDPRGGSFTGPSIGTSVEENRMSWPTAMEKHVHDYIQHLDAVPAHFQRHFMHAVEILGYKHPDQDIQMFWYELYIRLCREMHVGPETEDQLDRRLGDNLSDWLSTSDKATNA